MRRRSLAVAAGLTFVLALSARAEFPFAADPNRCDSSGNPPGCIPLPNEMNACNGDMCGTRLLYHVKTPGLSRVALSSDRSGGLRFRARGRGLDLSGANRRAITTVLGFGPDQFESTNVFRSIGTRLRFP